MPTGSARFRMRSSEDRASTQMPLRGEGADHRRGQRRRSSVCAIQRCNCRRDATSRSCREPRRAAAGLTRRAAVARLGVVARRSRRRRNVPPPHADRARGVAGPPRLTLRLRFAGDERPARRLRHDRPGTPSWSCAPTTHFPRGVEMRFVRHGDPRARARPCRHCAQARRRTLRAAARGCRGRRRGARSRSRRSRRAAPSGTAAGADRPNTTCAASKRARGVAERRSRGCALRQTGAAGAGHRAGAGAQSVGLHLLRHADLSDRRPTRSR